MKKVPHHFAFLCLLLFSNFQCDEDSLCEPVNNTASLRIDLNPEKKEYQVGDTLFLSAEFVTLLPLTNSNETIAVDNGECYLELFVMRLGMQPSELVGLADFEVVKVSGDLSQEDIWDEEIRRYESFIQFNCNEDNCQFKIGLIPKVKGSYCIAMGTGRIVVPDTTSCPPSNNLYDNTFEVNSFNRDIFEQLDIHYPILLPSTSTARYLDIIDNDGAFAFKVK